MDLVADVLTEVSATAIEPLYTKVAEREVFEKTAGELVTVADLEAERLLTGRLQDLLPGVPVVGEEACAADPDRLALLETNRCWVVDPLDGTANFVAGSPDWAVMVSLVDPTAALAAWIWQPLRNRMYRAERGAGTTVNGVRTTRLPPDPGDPLKGVVMTKFLDDATRNHVAEHSSSVGSVTGGSGAAGIEYPAIVDGELDFISFWRTRPWDHAGGALLVEEAGGHVRQLDHEPYVASERRPGLLVAASSTTWDVARGLLGANPTGVATD